MHTYNFKHTTAVVVLGLTIIFLVYYTLAIIIGTVKPDITDIFVFLSGFAIIHLAAWISHEVMTENAPRCCPKEIMSYSPSKEDSDE